jgi:hypothetical protein
MTIATQFKEYIWLVNIIRKAPNGITFAEINKQWVETDMSGGVEFSRSTFCRHKDAIQDIFGIYIECDRRRGFKYFIGNERVLREDSIQNWMLSTLAVNNIVSESLSLQDRILLESVPVEGDVLKTAIEAMRKKLCVKVLYRKYGDDTPKERCFEPYCIKLFKKRWYILGHFDNPPKGRSHFMMFSFDRIMSIELTEITFEIDPDFNAVEYFSENYGVLVHDGTPVTKVVIRAYSQERFYWHGLPIHNSQKLIGEGKDYADFELTIRPTRDFANHLLSRGALIKVLSPTWLADQLQNMFSDALKRYEDI